ncbi:magnesium and cobalt transport protein CorA [Streptomyces sp. SP18CS02]|uniref:magnesium and cobalt transport protein CorA n=1 Tax=Streptomyces sp. SP18CS02 TaxID=3002531 RepID=UPI002E76B90E|nr:magnesium and cobalt transport protein CorA [Streptomyces sp. SP18CS02]MEE1752762.1 magnesium and cobalt transport protein CorA [Streptomyces sp. SP18CS02]
MECVIYRSDGSARTREEVEGSEEALKRLRDAPEGTFLWIRLTDPSAPEVEALAGELGLHPLAVEDAVQAHQRPKRERYGDVLSVALRTLSYVDETSQIESGEAMVFLGPDFALTVCHGRVDPALEAARRLDQDPGMPALGPVAVLHALLDATVDTYTAIAEEVRGDLTGLERRVFSSAREDVIEEIYSLKREVLEFRDAVQPLVPVVQDFAGPRSGWPEEALPYFRDVADHVHRTDTEVRSLDELLNSVLDAHLARVGTWQNEDMRTISAWAAIFALPTLIAGLYGMNFAHMPELGWTYGYPLAVAVMVGACTLLHRSFRRNGWL